MKRFFQIILGFLAILLAVTGILVLTLRYKIANANLYKTALNESGIYVLLEDPEGYFSTDNDEIQIFLVPILENIQLGDLVKKTVETNIDFITAWFNGDDLFLFFPREDLVQTINSEAFRADAIEGFTEAFNNLPECTPDQITNYTAEINEGNQFIPECKPPNSEAAFLEQKAELERRLNEILGDDNNARQIIEQTDLRYFNEKTPVQTLLDRMDPEALENTTKALDLIENFMRISFYLGIGLIIGSIIITLLNLLMVKNMQGGLAIVSNTYIFVSLFLFGAVLAAKLLFGEFVNRYERGQIKISDERAKPFFESLIDGVEYVISNITMTWLLLAVLLLVMCLMMRVGSMVIKPKAQSPNTK